MASTASSSVTSSPVRGGGAGGAQAQLHQLQQLMQRTDLAPQPPQQQQSHAAPAAPSSQPHLYSEAAEWHTSPAAPVETERAYRQAAVAAPVSAGQPQQPAQLQQHLAAQMAADAELQQSLRAFSSSLGRGVGGNGNSGAAHVAPVGSYTHSSQQHTTYISMADSSMQSSAVPSPHYGPTSAATGGNYSSLGSLGSSFAPSPAPLPMAMPASAAQSGGMSSTAYTAQTSRQLVDIEFARHEAALAHARQRLEGMGFGLKPARDGQQRFVAPYPAQQQHIASVATSATPSVTSEVPSLQAYSHAPQTLANEPQYYQQPPPPHPQQHQQRLRQPDEDSLLNSSSDEEDPRARHLQPHPISARAASAERTRPAEAKQAGHATNGSGATTARGRSASVARSDAAASRGASTSRVKAVPRSSGTFGSSRSSGVGAAATARSASHKKAPTTNQVKFQTPLVAQSPTRPTSALAAPQGSPSKALVPHGQVPSSSAAGSEDDVSLAWADRYKNLLNKNLSLQKKNKELALRGTAYASSIQEMSSAAQQAALEKEDLLDTLKTTEDKLAACKSVLRAEREAAGFHAQKHLHAAEVAQVNSTNKLRHEYETKLESLEKANTELKRRAKNLQLVAHAVQTKLDAKQVESERSTQEAAQQVDALQASLATTTTLLNAANSKIAKTRANLDERTDQLAEAQVRLQAIQQRAESLATQLAVSETARTEMAQAFRSLQTWSEALIKSTAQDANTIHQEAGRLRHPSSQRKETHARDEEAPSHQAASSTPVQPASQPTSPARPSRRFTTDPHELLPPSAPAAIAAASPRSPSAGAARELLPRSSMLRQSWLDENEDAPLPRSPARAPVSRVVSHLPSSLQQQQPAQHSTTTTTTTTSSWHRDEYFSSAAPAPASAAAASPTSVYAPSASSAAAPPSLSAVGSPLTQLQERLRRLQSKAAML